MVEWLPWYEKWLISKGVIKRNVDIYQLIGSAPASAGYHKSGASADIYQKSPTAIRGSRNGGAAGFARGNDRAVKSSDGMMDHQHLSLKGCPHLTAGAKGQITELERGGDGLVGSRRDNGPRDGVKWPLRTYKEGIAWFKSELGEKPDAPKPAEPPAPKLADRLDPRNYGRGKSGDHITWYGNRLKAHGFGDKYTVGPGPTWGPADEANTKAFQKAQGWSGDDADGLPGAETLRRLAADPK